MIVVWPDAKDGNESTSSKARIEEYCFTLNLCSVLWKCVRIRSPNQQFPALGCCFLQLKASWESTTWLRLFGDLASHSVWFEQQWRPIPQWHKHEVQWNKFDNFTINDVSLDEQREKNEKRHEKWIWKWSWHVTAYNALCNHNCCLVIHHFRYWCLLKEYYCLKIWAGAYFQCKLAVRQQYFYVY